MLSKVGASAIGCFIFCGYRVDCKVKDEAIGQVTCAPGLSCPSPLQTSSSRFLTTLMPTMDPGWLTSSESRGRT